jgi:hypothetical protein
MEKIEIQGLKFAPSEGALLHEKLWCRYSEADFFRFLAVRNLIAEMVAEQDVEVTYFGHQDSHGAIREEYVVANDLFYKWCVAMGTFMTIAGKLGGRYKLNVDQAVRRLQRLRGKARRMKHYFLDEQLRNFQRILLNLPGEVRCHVNWSEKDHAVVVVCVWPDWVDKGTVSFMLWDKGKQVL